MKTDSESFSSVPLVMFGDDKFRYLPGGSGGLSSYDGPFSFDEGKGKIVNCKLMFGRTMLSCPDVTCTKETFYGSDIYAVVDHSGSSPALSVHIEKSGSGKSFDNSLTATYRLLYSSAASDGQSSDGTTGTNTVDYRGMPFLVATD